MKKYLTYLLLFLGANFLSAEDISKPLQVEKKVFTVTVSQKEGQVIKELLQMMGESSIVYLMFQKSYLKSLAKQLNNVSSTQFLAYVFERRDLIKHMKQISNSSVKWKSLTKSIVRGLIKESEQNLREDIPSFAKLTKSNKNILEQMVNEENWDGFILHLLQQN
jgi:hypothetical protein